MKKFLGFVAPALAGIAILLQGCETTAESTYSTRETRDQGTPGERDVGPAPDRAGAAWGGW